MNKRYKKISKPDGTLVDTMSRPYCHAYIEKIDGRCPINKYYRYRFWLRGSDICSSFNRWMLETFGPSVCYYDARQNVRLNVSLENVKWVLDYNDKSYTDSSYIYFNKECETLIFLKFLGGATLE